MFNQVLEALEGWLIITKTTNVETNKNNNYVNEIPNHKLMKLLSNCLNTFTNLTMLQRQESFIVENAL